jgi:hypothetical protein
MEKLTFFEYCLIVGVGVCLYAIISVTIVPYLKAFFGTDKEEE